MQYVGEIFTDKRRTSRPKVLIALINAWEHQKKSNSQLKFVCIAMSLLREET